MPRHQLTEEVVAEVSADLSRLGATCYIARKLEHRGRWRHLHEHVPTFQRALALVDAGIEGCEVAIFLEHERCRGIMVWSSGAPDVANRFANLR